MADTKDINNIKQYPIDSQDAQVIINIIPTTMRVLLVTSY